MQSDSHSLENQLPREAIPEFIDLLKNNNALLKITKERKSKYGDYRWPRKNQPFHAISVNGNLNPFAFMTTLIHEIAHMLTRIEFGDKVSHHGPEWKKCYSNLLLYFSNKPYLPHDIMQAWKSHAQNPKASSASDVDLFEVLKRYDSNQNEQFDRLMDLKEGDFFVHRNRLYVYKKKRRTRILCEHVDSKKQFLIHLMAEVERINLPLEQ